jgi:hypothetical protein
MKCFSENNVASLVFRYALRVRQSCPRAQRRDVIRGTKEKAFTLAETMAALVILAFVSTSVLLVINRYMSSAVDSVLRMQAFEVARTNLEKLLTLDTVAESVEYGDSEIYPDIQWQTVVEAFYEPLNSKMWIQAICSAKYTDSEGEVQKVELTHWLTDLTKAQMLQILAQRQQEQELLADQIIETLEEAAMYAGVDEQTIQQWIDNGMLLTEDGRFIKDQLDLYRDSNGNPSIEDRKRLEQSYIEGGKTQPEPGEPPRPDEPVETPQKPEDMTPDELDKWFGENL